MQLYHHPLSIDSQKVRLALEEKGIDYTSHHVNPVTGKNLDASFFRMNPMGELPVFRNGSHILFETIEIIQYVERIAAVSHGVEAAQANNNEVAEWMYKIQAWNSKYFMLSHIPKKHIRYVFRFLRRVIMARMAECPELASGYHLKLKEIYETEERLNAAEVVMRSREQLVKLLDEVEKNLNESEYLAGSEFSVADAMLVPILARLVLYKVDVEYIACRPSVVRYWELVQQRPSYWVVIGQHLDGWRKHKTLYKTWCFLRARNILRRF